MLPWGPVIVAACNWSLFTVSAGRSAQGKSLHATGCRMSFYHKLTPLCMSRYRTCFGSVLLFLIGHHSALGSPQDAATARPIPAHTRLCWPLHTHPTSKFKGCWLGHVYNGSYFEITSICSFGPCSFGKRMPVSDKVPGLLEDS